MPSLILNVNLIVAIVALYKRTVVSAKCSATVVKIRMNEREITSCFFSESGSKSLRTLSLIQSRVNFPSYSRDLILPRRRISDEQYPSTLSMCEIFYHTDRATIILGKVSKCNISAASNNHSSSFRRVKCYVPRLPRSLFFCNDRNYLVKNSWTKRNRFILKLRGNIELGYIFLYH